MGSIPKNAEADEADGYPCSHAIKPHANLPKSGDNVNARTIGAADKITRSEAQILLTGALTKMLDSVFESWSNPEGMETTVSLEVCRHLALLPRTAVLFAHFKPLKYKSPSSWPPLLRMAP